MSTDTVALFRFDITSIDERIERLTEELYHDQPDKDFLSALDKDSNVMAPLVFKDQSLDNPLRPFNAALTDISNWNKDYRLEEFVQDPTSIEACSSYLHWLGSLWKDVTEPNGPLYSKSWQYELGVNQELIGVNVTSEGTKDQDDERALARLVVLIRSISAYYLRIYTPGDVYGKLQLTP